VNVKATKTRNNREEKYSADGIRTIAQRLLEKHTNLVEIKTTSLTKSLPPRKEGKAFPQ